MTERLWGGVKGCAPFLRKAQQEPLQAALNNQYARLEARQGELAELEARIHSLQEEVKDYIFLRQQKLKDVKNAELCIQRTAKQIASLEV